MNTTTATSPSHTLSGARVAAYLLLGTLFGVVLIKSEVASWYRIQEMFRFQSFHLYGVLGSAFATATVSLQIIKRLRPRSLGGAPITLPPKEWGAGKRYWVGGGFFGLGWGLAGSCPGPIFALIGAGHSAYIIVLLAALAGTWTYAHLRPHLPH